MNTLSKISSCIALGLTVLAPHVVAGQWGAIWSARTGELFAQINVPSACSVSITDIYVVAGSGGYVPWPGPPGNIWVSNGQITANWGPVYIYSNPEFANATIVVYGENNGYFRGEVRDTAYPGQNQSIEYGQPTAGVYTVEASGAVGGGGQATANINIVW